MDGPVTPGLLGWIYDFQNLVAGLLALGAGVLAYLAGKHQANETRAAARDQINSANQLHETERRDEAERMVNVAANTASQVQFEAAMLQRSLEITFADFGRLEEFKAAGKVPVANNLTLRIDKASRFLSEVWPRLEPTPVQISGPVGRLLVWLDDLVMRCADFRTTLESGGHMPVEVWRKEAEETITGFNDLNRAITAFFAEPSVDPAVALQTYQEARIAYAKEFPTLLKEKRSGAAAPTK
jgi:hypothetical protein